MAPTINGGTNPYVISMDIEGHLEFAAAARRPAVLLGWLRKLVAA